MRRRTRLLAVLPAAALAAATACAPFHAGAAATVGDHRISTQDLRTVVAREQTAAAAFAATPSAQTAAANGQKQATVQVAQQRALAELIQIQVLQEVARRLHATIASNAVGLERNQVVAGQQGGTEDQVRQLAAYSGFDLDLFSEVTAYHDACTDAAAPTDDAISAFTALPDHRVASVERVDIPSQAQAQQFVDQVRQQPGSFDSTVQSGGGSPTSAGYTARALAALAPGAALVEGSVLGPIRIADGDYAVLSVTAVRDDSTSVALDKDSLDRTALQQETFDQTYDDAVRALGVHVSPRFGAWTFPSPDGLGTVGDVASAQELSTPVATSPSAAASTAGS